MSERPAPGEVSRVAVLGAGTIGASWAALFLARGFAVEAFDPDPASEGRVRRFVEQAWPSLERLGLAERGDPARLRFHGEAARAAREAQLVQESVPERLDLKLETYRAIEPALAPGTVVATSTSGLLLSDLQQGFARPERLVLAHPFNPPHLIPLVELLGDAATDESAVAWAAAFYARCGKTTIRLRRQVPGHVANRLQAALWREAIHLVSEGVASVADVDRAIVEGPGLRWAVMGPHMLFRLGSGGAGIEAFCTRFGPSIESWWRDLGRPELGAEVVAKLAEGLDEEAAGRSDTELAEARDAMLVALLRTRSGESAG